MKKPNKHEATMELNGALSAPAEGLFDRRNGKQHAELRLPSIVVGRIVAVRNASEPLVDFPGNTSGELVPARSLVAVTETDAAREVALTFEDGDPLRPIIVGLIQKAPKPSVGREVKIDEESLVLTAKKEVVIQCGKASITLTSAGKVLIRGAYLLSRSSGVNRIKGGSVQIN
jgi:hypothetical protein